MLHNLVRERLEQGNVAMGIALPFAAPAFVELIGYAGFHWVLIDCEHGPMNLETVETMIRAAEWVGITPVVRPQFNDPPTILHYLDMGAQGIYVPRVETKADAESAVASAKYSPEGNRGLAGYARWARAGTGGPMPQKMKQANEQILVIALIETAKGVENIDEIANVPGIDIIAVGPADLSQSLGVPGQINHPEVERAFDHVAARTLAAGKIPSYGAAKPQAVKALAARGVRCLTMGAQALVVDGGRTFLQEAGLV